MSLNVPEAEERARPLSAAYFSKTAKDFLALAALARELAVVLESRRVGAMRMEPDAENALAKARATGLLPALGETEPRLCGPLGVGCPHHESAPAEPGKHECESDCRTHHYITDFPDGPPKPPTLPLGHEFVPDRKPARCDVFVEITWKLDNSKRTVRCSLPESAHKPKEGA